MLIDTHCHLHDKSFDSQRLAVLKRARGAGVGAMIVIGCDLEDSRRAQGLAQIHEDVFFSVGVHPHEAQKASLHFIESLRPLTQHPKCVAIGECGLDFYYTHSPKEIQQDVFLKQISLSQECKKALCIHIRDVKEEYQAYDLCIQMLQSQGYTPAPIVIHCFSGTLKQAWEFVELGAFLSISGMVTFKNNEMLSEVVRQIPLEHLLIETDAPYLAPMPYRGQLNEPAFVVHVAQKIAELKELSFKQIAKQTTRNAQGIFAL